MAQRKSYSQQFRELNLVPSARNVAKLDTCERLIIKKTLLSFKARTHNAYSSRQRTNHFEIVKKRYIWTKEQRIKAKQSREYHVKSETIRLNINKNKLTPYSESPTKN